MWGVGLAVLVPAAGYAVELTPDARSEMRERAGQLQAQRERDPGWDGGTRRLNESVRETPLDRPRGEVKPRAVDEARGKREPARSKMKRTVKNLPGVGGR